MNWHRLPFSHGIEVENHIVDSKGQVIAGDTLVETWKELFSRAGSLLQTEMNNAPDLIKKKVVRITTEHNVRRVDKSLSYHAITYRLGKSEEVKTYAFGPDPNVSQLSWLLELVTPPCEYLEEIDWWIKTLYKASELRDNPNGYQLLPIGIAPAEKSFRSGLSCGEHHHLGIPNHIVATIYNCLRAFVPHLVCITTNSPLMNFSPTGNVKISLNDQGYQRVIAKNCTRSLRLKLNTTQVGPNSINYLPHLTENSTRSDFSNYVRKPTPDDKYVDIFPFSDHGTIELRFFDALFSHSLRLALIAILQALALKSKRLLEKNVEIPDVGAESLFENRRKAIDIGLLGRFRISDKVSPDPSNPFWRFYVWDPQTGEAHSKLFQACRSMLYFIKEELLELEFLSLVNPILAFLWGTEEPEKLAPPFSLAEEILRRVIKRSQNKTDLINNLTFPGSTYLQGVILSSSAKEFLLSEPAEPVLVSLPPKRRITQLTPIPMLPKQKKKLSRKKRTKKPLKPKKPKDKKKRAREKKETRKKPPRTPKIDDHELILEDTSKAQELKEKIIERPPMVTISKKEKIEAATPIPDISAAHRGIRDATIAEAMKKRKERTPVKIETLPVTDKDTLVKPEVHFVEPRPKKFWLGIPKTISMGMQVWIPKVEWAKKGLDDFEKGHFEVKIQARTRDKTELFSGGWESVQPSSDSPLIVLPVLLDTTQLASKDVKVKLDIEATFEHQIVFRESLTRKMKVRDPLIRIAKVAYERLHGFTKVTIFLESNAKGKGTLETRIMTPHLEELLIDEKVEFSGKESTKLERHVYIPPSVLDETYWLVTSIAGQDRQDTNYRRVASSPTKIADFNVKIVPKGGKKKPYSKIDIETRVKFQTSLHEPVIRLILRDPVHGSQVLTETKVKGILEHGRTLTIAKRKWKPPKGLIKVEFAIEIDDRLGPIKSGLIGAPQVVPII